MKKGTKKKNNKTPIIKIEKQPKKKVKTIKTNGNKIATAIIVLIAIGALAAFFILQRNKEYHGYWCKYKETATIVVLLKDDYTSKQKTAIETKINSYIDIEAMNTFSKDEYANQIGGDANEMDIHDAIVATFSSMNSIGTYVEELKKFDGVLSAEQSYAKNDINLYNLKKDGKYTYADSDEALKKDIIEGKYKEKDGVLTFTPTGKNTKQKLLYYRDGILCEDAGCTKLFFRSDKSCKPESSTKDSE